MTFRKLDLLPSSGVKGVRFYSVGVPFLNIAVTMSNVEQYHNDSYLVQGTNYEAHHSAVFSSLPLLALPWHPRHKRLNLFPSHDVRNQGSHTHKQIMSIIYPGCDAL
jgi:hypothetical protein